MACPSAAGTKQLLPRQGLTKKAVDNTPFDSGDLSETPILHIRWVLNVDVSEEAWQARASHSTALSEGYEVHGGGSFAEQSNVVLSSVSTTETWVVLIDSPSEHPPAHQACGQ